MEFGPMLRNDQRLQGFQLDEGSKNYTINKINLFIYLALPHWLQQQQWGVLRVCCIHIRRDIA